MILILRLFIVVGALALTCSAQAATYVFDLSGVCLERNSNVPAPPLAAFQKNYGQILLYSIDPDPAANIPLASIRGTIGGGLVTGLVIDPAWTPPAPPVDPLEEMRALVRGNVLASEHDKRWLTQKEAAKAIAIPWIKAHPACTQAEFQAAVFAALVDELPAGEPIVVNPDGIIASYALAAQARGLIQEASFTALRDLVVDTPEKHLNKLLAEL